MVHASTTTISKKPMNIDAFDMFANPKQDTRLITTTPVVFLHTEIERPLESWFASRRCYTVQGAF